MEINVDGLKRKNNVLMVRWIVVIHKDLLKMDLASQATPARTNGA